MKQAVGTSDENCSHDSWEARRLLLASVRARLSRSRSARAALSSNLAAREVNALLLPLLFVQPVALVVVLPEPFADAGLDVPEVLPDRLNVMKVAGERRGEEVGGKRNLTGEPGRA